MIYHPTDDITGLYHSSLHQRNFKGYKVIGLTPPSMAVYKCGNLSMSKVATTATRGTIIHMINTTKDTLRMRTTTHDYVQLQCIQYSFLVRNKTNNQSIIVRSVADWRMPDTSGMSRSVS